MAVRLAGGRFRGRKLVVPPGARPSEGRLREALFSRWAGVVVGARFLDLFAGSGVVGLEAASRGAGAVTWVDGSARAVSTIRANAAAITELDVDRRCLRLDLARRAARLDGTFDLVFADPPYAWPDYARLLEAVAPRLAATGELAIEHDRRRQLDVVPKSLDLIDVRHYGDSSLSTLRSSAPAEAMRA